MSFVARKDINPIESDALDINDGGVTVKAGAFWPEISLANLRQSMRLNGLVTTDRLQHNTREAVRSVTRQLTDWKDVQEASGFTALSNVPAEEIDGQSVLIYCYQRAVYCMAKALLTEGYRDFDTTGQGEKHAAALTSQIDTLWRDANWAIRDIQDSGRGLAELV
jgi:hypothetical protein